jgi:tetratricopeptide (TPR) repeat protein
MASLSGVLLCVRTSLQGSCRLAAGGMVLGRRSWWLPVILCSGCLLVFVQPSRAQESSKAGHSQADTELLNRQFKSAVADYNSGHFAEAAAQLEKLVPQVPNSFEAHELLGLVYASMSQNERAIEQLQAAVRIQPKSAEARTNLATSLSRGGKMGPAGEQFRKALELEPDNFTANHNLGEYLVHSGKLAEAIPFLEKAQRDPSSSYDNDYDLATAEMLTGRLADARKVVESMIEKKDAGELRNLLGQIEERDGQYVVAVKEFERAAHMDPSEDNLFDWGSEFLLHRTYEPAVGVFQQGSLRYPASSRMKIGLGMALDLEGKYDDAVKALLAAADLDPKDARCYLFLSKAYDSSPNQAEEVIQRFRRYAELESGNAQAQYYYAMSLWKGKRAEDGTPDFPAIESLLKKSIALDEKLPEAHVQLGNLYADRHEYAKSIPEYTRALELDSNLADAHYRLGQDYVHSGQKDRAQAEFDVYQRLRTEHLAEVDKERAEVQQFVYSAKPAASAKP